MTEHESRLRQRTAGRLNRSRDPAILNAALGELTEHGYRNANMNDIAARAGVGKAAIYRRWASKAALITDALVYWRPGLADDDIPSTGSLRGDLDAVVERAATSDEGLISNDLVIRVAMEAAHDTDLASALEELLVFKGRRLMTGIIRQAVERGEIAERDWSMVADVVMAMSLMRVVSGQRMEAQYLRDVIETLVLPALSGNRTERRRRS